MRHVQKQQQLEGQFLEPREDAPDADGAGGVGYGLINVVTQGRCSLGSYEIFKQQIHVCECLPIINLDYSSTII